MSRLQKYLDEAWMYDRTTGKKFEILAIPPDKMKDIKDLKVHSEGIRFTADNKSKTLYVWDSYKANHSAVWVNVIGKGRTYICDPNTKVLQGGATKSGSKWDMDSWDDYEYKFYSEPKRAIKKAFKWVERYINLDYMDRWDDNN